MMKEDKRVPLKIKIADQAKRIEELEIELRELSDKRFTADDLKCPFPADFKAFCDLSKPGEAFCKHTRKFTDLIYEQAERIKELEDGITSMNNEWVKIRRALEARIRELNRKRAAARIMLIAARAAVKHYGLTNEEVLTKIIEVLEEEKLSKP